LVRPERGAKGPERGAKGSRTNCEASRTNREAPRTKLRSVQNEVAQLSRPSLVWPSPERLLQTARQFFERERFGHDRRVDRPVEIVCGEPGHERDADGGRETPELAREIESIHVGQAHVDKRRVDVASGSR